MALNGSGGPLRFRALQGTVEVKDGQMDIAKGWLQMSDSLYKISGSASLAEKLDIRLTRTAESGPQHTEAREAMDVGEGVEGRVAVEVKDPKQMRSNLQPNHSVEAYSITGPVDDPEVQLLPAWETAAPSAASHETGQAPETLKPEVPTQDVQKAEAQKREARNRNSARGAALVPATRE
jgi:hypothetical protein